MATSRPTVLTSTTIADFVQHVLNSHASKSTLVICSTKNTFIETLIESVVKEPPPQNPVATTSVQGDLLQQPTLRMLAALQTTRLSFCPDISQLRAYLATYTTEQAPPSTSAANPPPATLPLLAILNPIDLHRPTSAFSAQGLNRIFSLALEAACRSGCRLVIAECPSSLRTQDHKIQLGLETECPTQADEEDATPTHCPWDEEVSILNVTTKSFDAGGRGWVGRTVTLRRIVERWCVFKSLNIE